MVCVWHRTRLGQHLASSLTEASHGRRQSGTGGRQRGRKSRTCSRIIVVFVVVAVVVVIVIFAVVVVVVGVLVAQL